MKTQNVRRLLRGVESSTVARITFKQQFARHSGIATVRPCGAWKGSATLDVRLDQGNRNRTIDCARYILAIELIEAKEYKKIQAAEQAPERVGVVLGGPMPGGKSSRVVGWFKRQFGKGC
jgi:hypothetical protein